MSGSDEYTGYMFAASNDVGLFVLRHAPRQCADRRALQHVPDGDAGHHGHLRPDPAFRLYDCADGTGHGKCSGPPGPTIRSRSPRLPPRSGSRNSFWITGLLLFEFTLIFVIVHATAALLSGNVTKVQALAGTMTASRKKIERRNARHGRRAATSILKARTVNVVAWIIIALFALVFASVPIAAVLGILALGLDQAFMGSCGAPSARPLGKTAPTSCLLPSRCSSCWARSFCAPASRNACMTPWHSGCPGCPAA